MISAPSTHVNCATQRLTALMQSVAVGCFACTLRVQLSAVRKKAARWGRFPKETGGRDLQGRPAVAGWALSRCTRQSKRCRDSRDGIGIKVFAPLWIE